MTATQTTSSPANRVWTVRAGVTGSGMDLFHVYATDMDSARESVEQTARENWAVDTLIQDGFSVHADVPVTGLELRFNPFVALFPAPDFPAVDLAGDGCTCLFQGTTRVQDPACPVHPETVDA